MPSPMPWWMRRIAGGLAAALTASCAGSTSRSQASRDDARLERPAHSSRATPAPRASLAPSVGVAASARSAAPPTKPVASSEEPALFADRPATPPSPKRLWLTAEELERWFAPRQAPPEWSCEQVQVDDEVVSDLLLCKHFKMGGSYAVYEFALWLKRPTPVRVHAGIEGVGPLTEVTGRRAGSCYPSQLELEIEFEPGTPAGLRVVPRPECPCARVEEQAALLVAESRKEHPRPSDPSYHFHRERPEVLASIRAACRGVGDYAYDPGRSRYVRKK